LLGESQPVAGQQDGQRRKKSFSHGVTSGSSSVAGKSSLVLTEEGFPDRAL
jgi:hypothetical protein